MINKELFNKIDWRDYLEDYQINFGNNKSGIKIISKRKELSFEDLLNLTDSSVKMFEFDFDLRYTPDLIQCLMNGKSFEQQYSRNYTKNKIEYSFDKNTNILSRKVNGSNKDIQLTDEYIVAICKFILERQGNKINRDVTNSQNQNKVNTSNEIDIEDIFNKYIKTAYLNTIEIGKTNEPNKTVRAFADIYFAEFSNFKMHTIKDILNGNKIKVTAEIEEQLISKLNNLMKEELIKLEEQENGTN